MNTGYLSVQCIELLHGGARATGVRTGICTWAVTHMGVGKGSVYLCQLKRPDPLSSQKENLAAKPQAKYGETDVFIPTNTLHSHEVWRRIIMLNNVTNASNSD